MITYGDHGLRMASERLRVLSPVHCMHLRRCMTGEGLTELQMVTVNLIGFGALLLAGVHAPVLDAGGTQGHLQDKQALSVIVELHCWSSRW